MDTLYDILTRHDMDLSFVESEITLWLEALLQLIDIKEEQSIEYLNYFIQGKNPVIMEYLHVSLKYVSNQSLL